MGMIIYFKIVKTSWNRTVVKSTKSRPISRYSVDFKQKYFYKNRNI